MKRFLTLMFAAFTIFSGAAISDARDKCLVMGLIPVEDPRAMIAQYTPMKKWLEKDMGRCIKVFTATDYTAVIEAMRAKRVDFAWFGGFSYVLARERAGAEAFAVIVDGRGKTTYHSYLVTTPEAAQKLGITSPLEGKTGMKTLAEKLNDHKKQFTFAFVDIASTSGYAVPRYFMHKGGINPDKVFKKTGFMGTHDGVAVAVKHKTVDIGAISDATHMALLERGRISPQTNVIIWISPEIPNLPVAYRGDLPEDVKAELRRSITRVPVDVVAGWGRTTGYQLVTDRKYDVIRDMKKVLDGLK